MDHPPNPHEVERPYDIALCGEEARTDRPKSWLRMTAIEADVSCPKCLQKLAKAKLKARASNAPALSIEQDKEAKGYFRHQQGWRAFVGGEHVAFLGYEDRAWRVYRITLNSEAEGKPWVGRPLEMDGSTGSRSHYGHLSAASFGSKETALLAVEKFRAEGHLPTYAELLTELEENLAHHRAFQAEQAKRKKQADETRQETIQALSELLDEHTLSNFQRQGVMNALELLQPRRVTEGSA